MSHSSNEVHLKKHMASASRMVAFQVAADSDSGFTAQAAGHSIFIQADSISELQRNADDAVLCHFGETNPQPKTMLHFDDEESRPA